MLIALVIMIVMAIKEAAILPQNVLFWLWMSIIFLIAGIITCGVTEVKRCLKRH